MGWSNAIPNPLVVGGSGQSGVIEVYDAAGNLLLVIDEDGITVYDTSTGLANGVWDDLGLTVSGPDGSYAFLTPDNDPGYYGGGAAVMLRPAYTGVQTITDPAVILGAEQTEFPILSLNAPTMNNKGLTFIDLFGEDAFGANPGHIQISTGGSGGYVEVFADLRLTDGVALDLDTYHTYTPTWTGSGGAPALGNGGLAARYIYLNKHTIRLTVRYAFGTTTTKGAGSYSWSLPVAAADTSGYGATGSGWINDSTVDIQSCTATIETGVVKLWANDVLTQQIGAAQLTGVIGASALQFEITYEVA